MVLCVAVITETQRTISQCSPNTAMDQQPHSICSVLNIELPASSLGPAGWGGYTHYWIWRQQHEQLQREPLWLPWHDDDSYSEESEASTAATIGDLLDEVGDHEED